MTQNLDRYLLPLNYNIYGVSWLQNCHQGHKYQTSPKSTYNCNILSHFPYLTMSIKSTQIALTWETFKLILNVSDMEPRASQTLHEVKVSDILYEEREGF